MNRRKYY